MQDALGVDVVEAVGKLYECVHGLVLAVHLAPVLARADLREQVPLLAEVGHDVQLAARHEAVLVAQHINVVQHREQPRLLQRRFRTVLRGWERVGTARARTRACTPRVQVSVHA